MKENINATLVTFCIQVLLRVMPSFIKDILSWYYVHCKQYVYRYFNLKKKTSNIPADK